MTQRFALLVGLSGLMGLSACSAMMTFTLAGGLDRPEVTFDGGRKACINELTVYEANDAAAPLWSIEAEGRRCVMLRHVVYGQTPLGFSVLTPAAPLRPDGIYEAVGGGSTTHPLSKIPWRGSARFHFRDGQWRIVETEGRGAIGVPRPLHQPTIAALPDPLSRAREDLRTPTI